jgi:predicted PhzF superfamily epimerase YddE/YHI9
MPFPFYRVSAFTVDPFGGNPAAVCLLDEWLPESLLQRVAAENNLSETAFVVPRNGHFDLRWMTPTTEVDLCGHATLAAAFVLFHERGFGGSRIAFKTLSGDLFASRVDPVVELDFPSRPPQPCPVPDPLLKALGRTPTEVRKSRDYFAVFEHASDVAALRPNLDLLLELDALGLIVTAPGDDEDFVSRFFAPKAGVPEDPVTGSAHSSLIPYWSGRLKKTELFARQISSRVGELRCRDLGDRVGIGGQCALYCRGEVVL